MKYLFFIVLGLFIFCVYNSRSVNDSYLIKYYNNKISPSHFIYQKNKILQELHEKRMQYKSCNDYNNLFNIYSDIARLYSEYHVKDSTLYWFRQADLLLKADRIKNKDLIYTYYLIKSRAYIEYGLFHSSLQYYNESKLFYTGYRNDTTLYLEAIINCQYQLNRCNYAKACLILQNSYPLFNKYLTENHIENVYFGCMMSDILIYTGHKSCLVGGSDDQFNLKELSYSDSLHPVVLKYLTSKAFNLYHDGMLEEGMKYIDKAEKLSGYYFKENGNDYLSGLILLRKGELLLYMKNFYTAQEYLNASLRIFEKHPDAIREKAEIFYKLGSLYTDISDNKKSLQYYKKNVETNKLVNYIDPRTFVCLAICYKNENDYTNSRIYLDKSEKIIKENYGDSAHMLYYVYRLHSIIAKRKGDRKLELEYLGKARDILLISGNEENTELADIYDRFGRFYRYQDPLKSIKYYEKAIQAITFNYNELSIYRNPEIEDTFNRIKLASVLSDKAYSFYIYYKNITNDIKDLEACLNSYEMATKIRSKVGTEFLREDEKMSYVNIQRIGINNSIEIALKLYKITNDITYLKKAFIYSEKSKAVVLSSLINQEHAKLYSGIPDSILDHEREVESKIRNITYQLEQSGGYFSTDTKKDIESMQDQLFLLYKKQAELEHFYEKNYPEYFNLKLNPETISVEEIQDNLWYDQVVLEYTITTTNELYTFFITKDTFNVVIQDIDTSFTNKIKRVRDIISNYDVSRNQYWEFVDFENSSQYLYKVLIEPVRDIVTDKSLIIVPDDIINLIPFEVLVDNSIKTRKLEYSELPYLIYQNPVSYAYSMSLMNSKKEKNRKKRSRFVAFAPTYEKNDTTGLFPLIGSIEEVNSISNWYDGNTYTGTEATEEKFKKEIKKTDILHLSMHTVINDNNPDLSKLIFTRGKEEDGFLHNFEIYGLKIDSRLLVLSGCSTGMGELNKGEGLLSLARGFKYAGISNIILTQWTVTDKTSAQLMKDFYFFLSQGEDIEDALRHSKLNILLRKDNVKSHPYFWAGYLCFGNSIHFYTKNNNTYKYVIALIIIIIVLGFYKRKNLIQFLQNFSGS